MSQVVQAKCPHCRKVLRIPADWLSRSMRCKYCQKTFQAKGKPTAAANGATAAPAAKPSASVPNDDDPFSFREEQIPTRNAARSKARHKGGGTLLLVITFFCLFVLGAGGASFVAYKVLLATPPRPENPANDDRPPAKPVVIAKAPDKAIEDLKKANETPPPKKEDPPKKGNPKKKDNASPNPVPNRIPPTKDPFPRRALLISVDQYLMYNGVHYGSARGALNRDYPGSSTAVLLDRLTRPPMNFPATQVTELSDSAAKPHSTQKSVLETTIKDFLGAARGQDRVLILYAGHAAYLDEAKKAYLVPIDGNVKKPASLLPLKWVFDEFAKCKAQQKVLILDMFRFSPSRGFLLPGTGEGEEGTMPEGFDKELQNPPAGLQVWSSCVKDQCSVELDGGSAFLQALCHSMQGGPEMGGISDPTQAIPVTTLLGKVNQRLKDLLAAEKRTQVSRLTGKAMEGIAKFNPLEPLPPSLVLKPATVGGANTAGLAQVDNILGELKILPPVRESIASDMNRLRAQNLPAFAAKTLDSYKADGYQNIGDLQKRYKADKDAFTKEFPLRAAFLDSLEQLQTSSKISMREVLPSPVDPKRKAGFLKEQLPMAESIFFLEKVLRKVKEASKQRDLETSKRWQANFDFMHARLQSRFIYLFEYDYTLGQIRADNLPELAPGQSGWRIATAKKNPVEKKARDLVNDTKKIWTRIEETYPDTPWALIAQRERQIALGLQWRPKSD